MDKKLLRSEILEKLAQMSDANRADEDLKIFDNIVKSDVFKRAQTVFMYISVGHEADTRRIAEYALSQGKCVAIPRCIGQGIMHAVEIKSLAELVPDKYDIPSAPAQARIVNPHELDLVLVPAVAFDKVGNRLGRGGGYYDRYLEKIPKETVTMGICRAAQLLCEIPSASHDIPVDYVVSPKGISGGKINFSARLSK